jgi:hypothetical protein
MVPPGEIYYFFHFKHISVTADDKEKIKNPEGDDIKVFKIN